MKPIAASNRIFIRILAPAVTATLLLFLVLRLPALADVSAASTPTPEVSPTPTRLGSVNIPSDGKWHYAVTPYVFAPQINGTFQFPVPGFGTKHAPVTINAHEPLGSYLQHTNAFGIISGEARKNSAVAAFDFIWANISTQKAIVTPVSSNAGFRVTGIIWTVAAGGTIAHSDAATLDALIGVRSLNLNAALNWNFARPIQVLPQAGSVAKSGTVNDIVAELRGKVRVGDRFFVPVYFDGGFGSGSSTMQAAGGLAYDEPWGNIALMYRALIYNANPLSLNQRLTFNGLAIGATYKF